MLKSIIIPVIDGDEESRNTSLVMPKKSITHALNAVAGALHNTLKSPAFRSMLGTELSVCLPYSHVGVVATDEANAQVKVVKMDMEQVEPMPAILWLNAKQVEGCGIAFYLSGHMNGRFTTAVFNKGDLARKWSKKNE